VYLTYDVYFTDKNTNTGSVCMMLILRRFRVTIVAVKSGITYSECVSVAIVIQHAKRMPLIILSSMTCPAVPYFCTLSHKRHDCWKEVTEYETCAVIFSTTFV
jgi:hypothetical protein